MTSQAAPIISQSNRQSAAPKSQVAQDIVAALENGYGPTLASPDAFLKWCKANKLSLPGLADYLPDEIKHDRSFIATLAEDQAWYQSQYTEFLAAQRIWLQRGIRCLMIKSAGENPAFPHTSDNIDILVRPEDGVEARQTLRNLGYVELRNIEEPQKHLFRKFHAGKCVSAIHVHEQIAWFVGFLDDNRVWERKRPAPGDPDITIPSTEDAILINVAHACYENKLLRMLEIFRIRHTLETSGADLDWQYMEDVATTRGWPDGLAFMLLIYVLTERTIFGNSLVPSKQIASFARIVRDDRPVRQRIQALRSEPGQLPLDLSYTFCKRLYYRKILADPARSVRERLHDAAVTLLWGIRLKSGFRPQPGMIVSLSGADGSGKTAHADALVAALELAEIKTYYFWNRGGSTGLLHLIHRLRKQLSLATNMHESVDTDHLARRRARLHSPILSVDRSWTVAIDQVATYLWHVKSRALRGQVVIVDRYAYDTAIEMDTTLPEDARLSRLAIRAMLNLSPQSDLGFVLDVSSATAMARKQGEVWHSEFEGELQLYRNIAERLNLRLVSTEGDFADSNDQLIRDVFQAFMVRYETRRNAIFYANPSQKNRPDPIWAGENTR